MAVDDEIDLEAAGLTEEIGFEPGLVKGRSHRRFVEEAFVHPEIAAYGNFAKGIEGEAGRKKSDVRIVEAERGGNSREFQGQREAGEVLDLDGHLGIRKIVDGIGLVVLGASLNARYDVTAIALALVKGSDEVVGLGNTIISGRRIAGPPLSLCYFAGADLQVIPSSMSSPLDIEKEKCSFAIPLRKENS